MVLLFGENRKLRYTLPRGLVMNASTAPSGEPTELTDEEKVNTIFDRYGNILDIPSEVDEKEINATIDVYRHRLKDMPYPELNAGALPWSNLRSESIEEAAEILNRMIELIDRLDREKAERKAVTIRVTEG